MEKLNYSFKDPLLFDQALTHRSYSNERGDQTHGHNERLEFLGDAVLDLVLSQMLMVRFPQADEGRLSRLRARLVNEAQLAEMAVSHGLPTLLKLGKGEEQSGGAQKPRLIASAFEAVFGAVFLDGGYEPAQKAVEAIFGPIVDVLPSDEDYDEDFKTRFQERAQQLLKITPIYQVRDTTGPDHQKIFFVEVVLGDKVIAAGEGRSKKIAEQMAARRAMEELKWQ